MKTIPGCYFVNKIQSGVVLGLARIGLISIAGIPGPNQPMEFLIPY